MRKRQSNLSDDKSVTTQYIMNKTSLTPPPFIAILVQTWQLSGHVYVCYGYRFYLCFYDFSIRFWNNSDDAVFLLILLVCSV